MTSAEPYGQDLADKGSNPLLTILWNRGEELSIEVDGVTVGFPENHMITLMAGQQVRVPTVNHLVTWQFNREFYCIIDHDDEVSCAGLLFYGGSELVLIRLEPDEITKFDLLVKVFEDEFGNQDNIQGEMLRMLLKRLIIKLTRLIKEQSENLTESKYDLVRKFNLLVEQNFRKYHKVQEYADLLYKSPKTLSNVFKQYNDKTPLQVIHDRILLEARRLLLFTDKSIKEIAYDLGFDEISHFNRVFRKDTGQAPGEFRKSKF